MARFDAFCAATGRKPGGVSAELFGSNRKVEDMRRPVKPVSVAIDRLAEADARLEDLATVLGVTLPDAVENEESESESARPLQAGAA